MSLDHYAEAAQNIVLQAHLEYMQLKTQQVNFLTSHTLSVWDQGDPYVEFQPVKILRAPVKIPTSAASKRPTSKYYTTSHFNFSPNVEKSLSFLPYNEDTDRIIYISSRELDIFESTPYRPADPNSTFSGEFADFIVLTAKQDPQFIKDPLHMKKALAVVLGKKQETFKAHFAEIDKQVLHMTPYDLSLAPRFKDKYCRVCHDYNCHLHFFPENESRTGEAKLSRVGILRQVYDDDRTSRWRHEHSLEVSGIWMTSHSCEDRSSCFLLTMEEPVQATRREEFIIRKYLKKGVTNPCATALAVPRLTCAQVAFVYRSLEGRFVAPSYIPLPKQETLFTDRKNHKQVLALNAEFCECMSECTPTSCPCISSNLDSRARGFCEKFCSCRACSVRFTGCSCQYGGCRTNKCICYANSRECEPDLCRSCCAYFVIKNKSVLQFIEGKHAAALCQNLENYLRSDKRTAIAHSSIEQAGFGLYLLAPVEAEGYITEYTGELVDEGESERRGVVYNRKQLSYLFTLADTLKCVDATRLGNRMRFVNHKSHGEDNCTIKHVRVGGNLKILLMAGKKKLQPHSELFFNYNYPLDEVPFAWLHSYESKFARLGL
jgi:hypothetical protein